jgi:hypothetical protein
MNVNNRHTTATLAIVRPPTVVPCFWCGFTRPDHFGSADWADTLLRCPAPLTVRTSLGERQLRESTYQPLYRVRS